MAFSDETVKAAWNRAGGKCECRRTTAGHLVMDRRCTARERTGRPSDRSRRSVTFVVRIHAGTRVPEHLWAGGNGAIQIGRADRARGLRGGP